MFDSFPIIIFLFKFEDCRNICAFIKLVSIKDFSIINKLVNLFKLNLLRKILFLLFKKTKYVNKDLGEMLI